MSDSDVFGSRNDIAHVGFLLVDGFSLMSYAAIVEAFRAANLLAGRETYRWRHVGVGRPEAMASGGARILVDHAVGEASDFDLVFVCAAGNPALFKDRATFAWLRSLARRGVSLAGVSGGPYVLARAGLLEGYRCTIHWEHAPAFTEAFPRLRLEGGLYVIDGGRLTCAGGTAGLDLALELIGRRHGAELAKRVGEWFIRTEARSGEAAQRSSLRARYPARSERLLTALAHLEAHFDAPLDRTRLAALAGVSVRQLERLFRGQLGVSIYDHLIALRLDRAEALLRETGLSILEVAMASGFASRSHFARLHRQRLGVSPSQSRTAAM